MNGLIDPPSPFAELQEWQEFLAEMKKLDQNDPDVVEAVRMAEAVILRLVNNP